MIRRIALATALALVSIPLYATTYLFETQHTQGVIRWSHLGFANPTAQFSQVEGTLEFDEADPTKSSVMVTIPLADLKTGVPDLDDDFRSDDFFNLAKFPTATFSSTKVEKGSMPGRLKVTGDLRLHGVTKPVTLDVVINKVGLNPRSNFPTVGFDATATLMRSAFGLSLYVPQVSDEIRIQITAEAAEAKVYAAYLKAEAAKEAEKKASAAKEDVKKS